MESPGGSSSAGAGPAGGILPRAHPSEAHSPERVHSSSPVAKKPRVQVRGRTWIVTLNDRLEYPPSARYAEEAKAAAERGEDVDRAHAAAVGADEEEEAPEQGAAADARVAGGARQVGDRIGHFRHPTEVVDGLRGAGRLAYFVGQLERGPENGELLVFFL